MATDPDRGAMASQWAHLASKEMFRGTPVFKKAEGGLNHIGLLVVMQAIKLRESRGTLSLNAAGVYDKNAEVLRRGAND